jgi:hypothetical protein
MTAAVKRFSGVLSNLDEQVHEASGQWKRAVWAHTMEATKLDELMAARDALMRSVVEVSAGARTHRRDLVRRLYSALVDLWRAQQKRQQQGGSAGGRTGLIA